jgi:hypothetical protein
MTALERRDPQSGMAFFTSANVPGIHADKLGVKTTSKPAWQVAARAVQRLLNGSGDTSVATIASPSAGPAPRPEPREEPRPDLPPLDFFTGEPATAFVTESAPEPAEPDPAPEPAASAAHEVLEDPACQRVRDQYIGERFMGVARSSADLVNVRRTISSAHTYLEDGQVPRACELLELASAIQPTAERLWLATLELALRVGDAEAYRRAAVGLRRHHPASSAWPEVAALARTLCLTDEPFNNGAEALDAAPGPRKPNWLRESWELTPEFTHADVRKHVLGTGEDDTARRRAA